MDGSTNLSLNGNQGPQFNQGPEPNIPNTIDTLHEESLIDQSTDLGLGGEQGPSFDFGPEPNNPLNLSFHEAGLISTLTEPGLDLNGVDGGNGYFHDISSPGHGQGKQIGGVDLHEHLLKKGYTYKHGNSTEQVGIAARGNTSIEVGGQLDLDGRGNIGTSTFDKGFSSTLHEDLLTQKYNSPINPGASYGQGQPGGIWPSINAGGHDLNGNTPAGYINPDTGTTF